MADEYLGAGGGAFQAGAEAVEFAGRVDRVDQLAEGAANDVLRQLGAVLGQSVSMMPRLRCSVVSRKPLSCQKSFTGSQSWSGERLTTIQRCVPERSMRTSPRLLTAVGTPGALATPAWYAFAVTAPPGTA